MSAKRYRVKELAELSGLTVRTLHHYDERGLLVPEERSAAGYRLYSEDDLLRLQQILVWRELGFSLGAIKSFLDEPGFDRHAALLEQRRRLEESARNAVAMIESVDVALALLAGHEEEGMARLFRGFRPEQYEEEVSERWGKSDAYAVSQARTKNYGPADWQRMSAELDALMLQVAEAMDSGLKAADAAHLAEEHRLHIDRWFYPCDRKTHAELAKMYVADPRFAQSFDRYREGMAGFVAEAVVANLAKQPIVE